MKNLTFLVNLKKMHAPQQTRSCICPIPMYGNTSCLALVPQLFDGLGIPKYKGQMVKPISSPEVIMRYINPPKNCKSPKNNYVWGNPPLYFTTGANPAYRQVATTHQVKQIVKFGTLSFQCHFSTFFPSPIFCQLEPV